MTLLTPTPAQLRWQQLEFGAFIHFGINTFAGKEWSDGTLPASLFNPEGLDAGSWVRTAKEAGARYLILTAKHHDGFCLWPTATTDYSVESSPWHGGSGDVVREVAEACAEQGVGLGLYLSPWDRNADCYSDPAAYDDFYVQQLTELCTGYGPLMELWFDGAGSVGREYDWDRIIGVVKEHQPDAMIFNMGQPTIRWVGNENGLASDPVNYVVDRTSDTQYTDSTSGLRTEHYLPPECDVSLRRGWFWHPDDEPKSTEHLLAIYYQSVGMGANLLLNLTPDTRGLIPELDVARLREWKVELDRRLSGAVEATVEHHDGGATLTFPAAVTFNHLELVEDLGSGQRITQHEVFAGGVGDGVVFAGDVGDVGDGGVLVEGKTVGNRRIHQLPVVTANRLHVKLSGAGDTGADGGLASSVARSVPGGATGGGGRLKSARVYTGALDAGVPTIPEGYEAPTDAPD
ncbi:alpha-L-fucosidase [Arthrobacter sp. StoSoilB20]|uniref:alpha-L-fucosidase n=1 Tax=Arthrobacter sp. StoSoilB20 TaxID=2830995 RepID=UPI001CC45773|nr:alpha-L-fucosidase [Arthrobacter sp. StoSoilB20]BCW57297.1 alpha-L-fucosidase [Arthrobacter sp. StoSoilB20]